MTIYPNPARASVTIDLKKVQDDGSYVAFFDIGGKMIKKVKCVNQFMYIDINELESGCYTVRLFNHDGSSQNALFIKQ
jgi:hypothetical protein